MSVLDETDLTYCSVNSLSKYEPLFGSAPKTDLWIALEYPYPPGDNAVKESHLPDEIKAHLTKLQKSIDNSRLVLIRNQHTIHKSNHSLFIVYANRNIPCLYEIFLENYEQLVLINDTAIINEAFALEHSLVEEQLFLICTNGKRDRCCARWGLPVYNELSKIGGVPVWQTSHVGGHRFAGNMICLPHGIYYGRVTLERAASLVDQYQAGLINLHNYRGRASYSSLAQAGEYFLRQQTMDLRLGAYQLISEIERNPDQWEVIFSSNMNEKKHRLHIAAELSDQKIFESCSTADNLKQFKQYRLIQYLEDQSVN